MCWLRLDSVLRCTARPLTWLFMWAAYSKSISLTAGIDHFVCFDVCVCVLHVDTPGQQRCCVHMFTSAQQQTASVPQLSNWPWNRQTGCIFSQTGLTDQYQHGLCTGARVQLFSACLLLLFLLSAAGSSSTEQQLGSLCTCWILYCIKNSFRLTPRNSTPDLDAPPNIVANPG